MVFLFSILKSQVQEKILAFRGSHEFIALFKFYTTQQYIVLCSSISKAQVQGKILAFLGSHEFIALFIPLNSI